MPPQKTSSLPGTSTAAVQHTIVCFDIPSVLTGVICVVQIPQCHVRMWPCGGAFNEECRSSVTWMIDLDD